MSPRTGRPKAENPKTNSIHVRLDKDDIVILEAYCQQENKKITQGIRDGIKLLKVKIK